MEFTKIITALTRFMTLFVVLLILFFMAIGSLIVFPDLLITKKYDNQTNKDISIDLPTSKHGQLIKYGYLLTSETPKWMGPMVTEKQLQYAGNNLTCKNCHLDNGQKKGAGSWIGVTKRYPQFRARENKMGSIEDRINGCLERSMNGKPLPHNAMQMKAIVVYMEWLSENISLIEANNQSGFAHLILPDIKADSIQGKAVYTKYCTNCHLSDGTGIKHTDTAKGYLYPPLWGNDSYNNGAGMNRVITAAQFIKANMPFGEATYDNPKLTDEEALHVAAYINSFNRPEKANLNADFEDRTLKPISTPYGPWADNFPAEQHKYGPFPPIADYYKKQYNLTKRH